MTKKRIGILLTESKNEANKEEIISLRRRIPPRPWIKQVDFKQNPDFRIDREAYRLKYFDLEVPRTVGIATDVSVGEYIKTYHGDTFAVDYIRPKDISKARLAQNDINFLIIYDHLESFHIDRSKGKRVYHNFLDVIKNSDNTYPSWELQEFIGSKLMYYTTFRSVGIPVAPTHTLTRDEFNAEVASESANGGAEGASDRVILKILTKIKSENWGKFIAKPEYGQESKSCKTFRPCANLQKMFTKYVIATLKKYPGIIFQKFIAGFGESIDVPEVRQYWVGKEYQFSMVATKTKIYCLAAEGHKPVGRKQNGMMKLPKGADLQTLKNIALKVIDVLESKISHLTPDGTPLPLLMTRVDMGVMRDGEFKPWVNEVEYVPSYYVEDHTHALEGTVAHQCAVIARKYLGLGNLSTPVNTGLIKTIEFKRQTVKHKPRTKVPIEEATEPLIDFSIGASAPVDLSAPLDLQSSVQEDMSTIIEPSDVQEDTISKGECSSHQPSCVQDMSTIIEPSVQDDTSPKGECSSPEEEDLAKNEEEDIAKNEPAAGLDDTLAMDESVVLTENPIAMDMDIDL